MAVRWCSEGLTMFLAEYNNLIKNLKFQSKMRNQKNSEIGVIQKRKKRYKYQKK